MRSQKDARNGSDEWRRLTSAVNVAPLLGNDLNNSDPIMDVIIL